MQEATCFCTFSRVTPEKGIDDAVFAIREANRRGVACRLDIWGPIDQEFADHYAALFQTYEDCVQYRGILEPNENLEKLSAYTMLLFPTFYPGEGFPISVCESFMAGLPVIASDWRFNSELIEDGVTGFLFPPHDREALTRLILIAATDTQTIEMMRSNAITYSRRFEPQFVMSSLTAWLNEKKALQKTDKPIGMIGYFGDRVDDPIIGGQMSKTVGIYQELVRAFGEDRLRKTDTSNWKREKGNLIMDIFCLARTCDPILILPNKNGIRIVLPMVASLKKIWGYSVAYPIVGGWLPELLKKKKNLSAALKQMDYLLPETDGLKQELREYYSGKMDVMPAFSNREPAQRHCRTWGQRRTEMTEGIS